MNFFQRLSPPDDVGKICGTVEKPAELVAAERALAETIDATTKATKRQGIIQQRLMVQNPTTALLTGGEEQALAAESRKLTSTVIALQAKARAFRAEIDRLMPDYSQSVAEALAPLRKRSARQLTDGVAMIEAALHDIDASNAALRKLGRSAPSVLRLPMDPYRSLAAKVGSEK